MAGFTHAGPGLFKLCTQHLPLSGSQTYPTQLVYCDSRSVLNPGVQVEASHPAVETEISGYLTDFAHNAFFE
jgi:hypothetical protein